MKLAFRITSLMFSMIFILPALAQIEKMEEAVDLENYKRLEKVCLSSLEDKQLKRNPRTYYYLAQAYVNLGTDPITKTKYPDGVKKAVKYMSKGIRKDDERSVLESEFTEILDMVISEQNKVADDQYGINKKAKAVMLYEKAYQLDSSRRYPFYMSGKSSIESGDTATGEPKFDQLMAWYAADKEAGDEEAEQEIGPYLYYADKYWQATKYDSAKLTISNARELFGNDSNKSIFESTSFSSRPSPYPPCPHLGRLCSPVVYFPGLE